MPVLNLILNVLWLLTGGLWMAIGWLIGAVLLAITIIGLPWARAAFSIAGYTLLPFGYRVVRRDAHMGQSDLGTGPLGAGSLVVSGPSGSPWGRSSPLRRAAPRCSCFNKHLADIPTKGRHLLNPGSHKTPSLRVHWNSSGP
jgi:hypothetical protein